MLGLCRHVFPHAEGHKFFIEHWGTSLFFNKMREIGAVMAENGFFESADDVFYLNIHEVHEALSDLGLAWSGGAAARGTVYWPPRVKRRKEILARLSRVDAAAGARRRARGDQRPDGAAAVGRHRRPAARLGEPERGRGRPGYAASPGVAEGLARVVRDVNEIGTVQQGEVLVCSVTAPSWGPVFPKIAAAVSDIGGMMSHAAIVAREYGLPAVVGTGHATKLIKTGDRVRVDGDNGTVTISDLSGATRATRSRFEELRADQVELVGGQVREPRRADAAAGFPVPPGFAVTTAAYERDDIGAAVARGLRQSWAPASAAPIRRSPCARARSPRTCRTRASPASRTPTSGSAGSRPCSTASAAAGRASTTRRRSPTARRTGSRAAA